MILLYLKKEGNIMATVLWLPKDNEKILADFKNKTIEELIKDYGFRFKSPCSIRATKNPHGELEPVAMWEFSEYKLDSKVIEIMKKLHPH